MNFGDFCEFFAEPEKGVKNVRDTKGAKLIKTKL